MEALGINPGFLISQIVNFAILLVLLRMLLYKPVLNMLQKRRERIRSDLDGAEAAKAEASKLQAEYQGQLDQARREGQEVVAQAVEQGEKAREDILEEAREEARQIVSKGRAELEYERQQALKELREQVVEMSIMAASKVVGESLDDQRHRRLVQDFLGELGEA